MLVACVCIAVISKTLAQNLSLLAGEFHMDGSQVNHVTTAIHIHLQNDESSKYKICLFTK